MYRACGPDSPEYVFTLSKLAGLYLAQGLYDKAEPVYERVLLLMEKTYSSEHPDVAMILKEMTLLYKRTGRIEDVKRVKERIAAIKLASE